MRERLECLLAYDDAGVMVHMKTHAPSCQLGSTSFDEFWDIVAKEVAVYSTVHSRREQSGPDYVAAVSPDGPPPASLADLYARCMEKAGGVSLVMPAPTYTWFKLQFTPKKKSTALAMMSTGRFNLEWRVQGHHLRGQHVDSYYGAKYFKFFREMAVHLRRVAVVVFQDDKKKVAVGEPGLPLAATSRTRAVLVCSQNECSDHDFHKFNVTPSVPTHQPQTLPTSAPKLASFLPV